MPADNSATSVPSHIFPHFGENKPKIAKKDSPASNRNKEALDPVTLLHDSKKNKISSFSFSLLLYTNVIRTDTILHRERMDSHENSSSSYYVDGLEETLKDAPASYALLFPWFTETIGVMVVFLLTYLKLPVPDVAVMFVIGTLLGSYATLRAEDATDPFPIRILKWTSIDSDVLLLVFLPGLIFRDAIEVNFRLFFKAFGQILLMAFPMVLMGTALTGAVAFYVLPYDWPWSLCMILGSILASTDTVAVSALMKKAGAPPRLKMLLSGESMLNDGSAIVFYSIFIELFLQRIGASSLEDEVTVGSGFTMFLYMAWGGFVVGLGFGLGLLVLLHGAGKHMEAEYNIVQVSVALSMAYLSYFVADQVWQMSGITACVTCGIVARALGKGTILRQEDLMDSYLALMEFLLNTLLFTLGGTVWGSVICNVGATNSHHDATMRGSDWGYVFLFYLLIIVIRFIQIGAFYPILSRIGLGSNSKEAVFLGYGGLRGAVGIALAVSFSKRVFSATDDFETRSLAITLEYVSGGVTLLTLLINGTTAECLLKKLGLADSGTTTESARNSSDGETIDSNEENLNKDSSTFSITSSESGGTEKDTSSSSLSTAFSFESTESGGTEVYSSSLLPPLEEGESRQEVEEIDFDPV